MLTVLIVILRSIGLICRGHRAVALENLALRQQVAALTRTVRRRQLRTRGLFWILLAQGVAGLAQGLARRAAETVVQWHRQWLRRRWTWRSTPTRPGRPARMRQFERSSARWPPRIHCGGASDSRRIVQAGPHGVRAHGVAALAATAAPLVADVADLSDQSCRHTDVDGLLHRVDADGPRAVCVGAAGARVSTNHSHQLHGTSHGGLDGATNG